MGKPKRGRCAKRNKNKATEPDELVQAPHSFVIHRGLPGAHILELTKDFRRVMEPYTATSLKERKKNTIKDFLSVAGPLHVSHICIFSKTSLGMYLKIARLPRGPTLTFKIHNFSFARDVVSSLKKQSVVEEAFKHAPLIVLNSFSGEGLHLKMMASMFQNMFPTINLLTVDLNTVRRCVLLNYNSTTKMIDFRHYSIRVVPVGISKGVKKVVQGKVPDLSRCNDIAEFFTKAGMLSESEAEDDPQHQVTVPQKLKTRGTLEQGKSAIRLSELGPRLTLSLIKIEDGLLDGEVLYHDLIHKSEEEREEIQRKREMKKKLKEKRKRIQEENKKKKEELKAQLKEKSIKGQKEKSELRVVTSEQKEEMKIDKNQEENAEVEDDDREYYREEVGEEPDKDLFSSRPGGYKRKFRPPAYGNKKRKTEDGPQRDRNQNQRDTRDGHKKSVGFKSKKRETFRKGAKGGGGERGFKRGGKQSGKGKRVDKTNSANRDNRPVGGNARNYRR
ncbi:unnamed protein product [Acanthoscelides obtectus]|uniref:Brix domain-containing protein n=1 Tax=Acanthoscelides obtectus TaxID=200917 RepID=A0A9P0P8L3_ACAOB|nr:unnamed protein product [Acanthoscelides obtectus]CAK1639556.1 Suppressor of SWI4 1 homolog [Acanthoscelides obtectus]